TLKEIYVMSNLILLIKSHYEMNSKNPLKGYKNIYAGFSYSNLFYKYPIPYNSKDLLKPMEISSNPPWCRDDQMNIPDYYYVKCRTWYKETVEFYEDLKLGVSITTPYKIEII